MVERVVVHMSSLVKGTRFVRPLTVNHLLGERGNRKMRRTDVHSVQDGRYNESWLVRWIYDEGGGEQKLACGQLVMHDLSLAHWRVPSPTRYG